MSAAVDTGAVSIDAGPVSIDTEAFRRECEARDWLRRGYLTPAAVDGLMVSIAKHRGQDAAAALREEMRRQWRLQRGAVE